MYKHQRGATFLGAVTIAAILGLALYAGIRLVPLYVEYMGVAKVLEQTAKEANPESTNIPELRRALDRRFIIESITSIKYSDVQIKKISGGFNLRAEYRAEAPFVSNVKLVADFDKSVDVK